MYRIAIGGKRTLLLAALVMFGFGGLQAGESISEELADMLVHELTFSKSRMQFDSIRYELKTEINDVWFRLDVTEMSEDEKQQIRKKYWIRFKSIDHITINKDRLGYSLTVNAQKDFNAVFAVQGKVEPVGGAQKPLGSLTSKKSVTFGIYDYGQALRLKKLMKDLKKSLQPEFNKPEPRRKLETY